MEVWLPLLSALPRDCGTFRFDTISAFYSTSFIYTLKRTIPSVRESFTTPSTHRSTFSTGILTGSSIGLGITITVESLAEEAAQYADNPGEWLRAYMNVLTEAADPLIPKTDLDALADLTAADAPLRSQIAVSYEVGRDNSCGAVLGSWRDPAGRPCTAVIHAAPGTRWMVPFLRMIAREWRPAVIAADDGGSTRRLTDELTNPTEQNGITPEPVEVYKIGARDHGTACDRWLTDARDDKLLRWDASRSLGAAVANAVTRKMAGGITFSREHSSAPIPSLIASAVGLWAYDHQDEQLMAPVTSF